MTKKSSSLRLWIVSIAAISFVTIGTIILVAFAQGYSFDLSTHRLRPSGLVLIDSQPNDASVVIDGKDISKKTPYRLTNAFAGQITIALQKADYRLWQAQKVVTDGEVTFVNYVMLLPNILYQQNTEQPMQYSRVVQSGNHEKTIALGRTPLTLYIINSSGQSKSLYQPPVATDPAQQVIDIDNIVVSTDGSRVLFRQKLNNGNTESILIQTSNGRVDNLSAEFGFVFTDLRFNQRDANELFWLEANVLKKIHINERSISANLVSDVFTLSVEKDRLLVVRIKKPADATQQLASYDLSGGDEKAITSLTADEKGYQTSFIRSRYDEYITVIHNSTGRLELIKDPYTTQTTTELGSGVSTLTSSPNGRFLILNQNNVFVSMDLEFAQNYSFNTSLQNLQQWAWFDDYHLVMLQAGQLRLIDFDGQNNQLLTPTPDVTGVSLQPNDKMVMPLSAAGNLYRLWLVKK